MYENFSPQRLTELVEHKQFRPLRELLTEMNEVDIAEFLDELEQYRPFGRGFEMPSILLRFHSKDAVEWKRMGKDPSDRSRPGPHLKIVLPNGFDVICWNQGFLKDTEEPKDGWHRVVGHLERSTFRDQVRIQFVGDLERGVEDVSN